MKKFEDTINTFLKAYTSWEEDAKDLMSHQRLIKYVFNKLRCLIRSENDDYFKNITSSESNPLLILFDLLKSSTDDELSSILLTVESIAISEKVMNKNSNLTVKFIDYEVSQSIIFDLKTRSAHREIDMKKIYSRLWVSQIRKFIIVYYNFEKFNDIRVQDLSDDIHDWEK